MQATAATIARRALVFNWLLVAQRIGVSISFMGTFVVACTKFEIDLLGLRQCRIRLGACSLVGCTSAIRIDESK